MHIREESQWREAILSAGRASALETPLNFTLPEYLRLLTIISDEAQACSAASRAVSESITRYTAY